MPDNPVMRRSNRTPGRVAIAAISLIVAVGLALLLRGILRSGRPSLAVPLPPTSSLAMPVTDPVDSSHARAASCRSCHPAEFDRWAGSHHALAERGVDPAIDTSAFTPARTFNHGSQASRADLVDGQAVLTSVGLSGAAEAQKGSTDHRCRSVATMPSGNARRTNSGQ